jgi:hypothetical protein
MKGKDFFSRKRKDDNVYTPYSMAEQLLENEKFDYNRSVLEPASGVLAIFNVLSDKGFLPIHGDIKNGFDFLKKENITAYENKPFDYIITNPPYSLWDEFIQKAKEIAIEKFAFLGRLEFLTGISRYNNKIYSDPNYPLTKVYIFVRKVNLSFFNKEKETQNYFDSVKPNCGYDGNKLKEIERRINYPELREDGKYPAGMYHYAWFIFESKYYFERNFLQQPKYPIIKWINNQKYILHKEDIK